MDPNHRDSTAFMRIVSGVFERDMMVFHVGSGKEIRLARSHRMLAGSRDTLELAYPGDIEWEKGYLEEQNPQHELVDFISPVQ